MSDRGVVALVDDDPAVLDSLKFLLEAAGYPVAAYDSATAFLDDSPAHLACLIVDHHMPTMTGLELVARLREASVMLPALLITGAPSPAIAARAKQLGVEMLEKPVPESDMLKFIDAHPAAHSGPHPGPPPAC